MIMTGGARYLDLDGLSDTPFLQIQISLPTYKLMIVVENIIHFICPY
jgi:hypothetical protein